MEEQPNKRQKDKNFAAPNPQRLTPQFQVFRPLTSGFRSHPPSTLLIQNGQSTLRPILTPISGRNGSSPILVQQCLNNNYQSPLPQMMRFTPLQSLGTGGIMISPFRTQFNGIPSETSPNGHFIFSPIDHKSLSELKIEKDLKKQEESAECQPIKQQKASMSSTLCTLNEDEDHKCDLCQKPLICPMHLLKYHKNEGNVSPNDKFPCFECDAVLENKDSLQAHIKDSHRNLLYSLQSIFGVKF